MRTPRQAAIRRQVVTTGRLTLVPVDVTHIDDLVLLHKGPDVAHWYAGSWTLAHARRFAEEMSQAWTHDGVGKWMAYRTIDNEFIGRGGLTWTRLADRRRLEVGWAIREEHRGQGYATEIGRAGLSFAFDSLDASEVIAYTEVHNRASRRVMERLGMTYTELINCPGLLEGEGLVDSAPFALYRATRSEHGKPAKSDGATRGTGSLASSINYYKAWPVMVT